MTFWNPRNDPHIAYLLAWARTRIDRARAAEHRGRGASAIEWAIITGILAVIAITIGGIIMAKVKGAADKINTDSGTGK